MVLKRVFPIFVAGFVLATMFTGPVGAVSSGADEPSGEVGESLGVDAFAPAVSVINISLNGGNTPDPAPPKEDPGKPDVNGNPTIAGGVEVETGTQRWKENPAGRIVTPGGDGWNADRIARLWSGPGGGGHVPPDQARQIQVLSPGTYLPAAGSQFTVGCEGQTAGVMALDRDGVRMDTEVYPYGYTWSVTSVRPPQVPHSVSRPTGRIDPVTDLPAVDPVTGDLESAIFTWWETQAPHIVGGTVRCLWPLSVAARSQKCALSYRAPSDHRRAAEVTGPRGVGLPASSLVSGGGRPVVELLAETVEKTVLSGAPSGQTVFGDYFAARGNFTAPSSSGQAYRWVNFMKGNCGETFAQVGVPLVSPGNYKVTSEVMNVTCRWWDYSAGWVEVDSVAWAGCDEPKVDPDKVTNWVWKGCGNQIVENAGGYSAFPPSVGPDAEALAFPPVTTNPGDVNNWSPSRCAAAKCVWTPAGGYDPGQLQVTVWQANGARSGSTPVVLRPTVTREPADMRADLSTKLWLAKADGATGYQYHHFMNNITVNSGRGRASFVGTVWQTADSATPWRLEPRTGVRLGVDDPGQPFLATTVGETGRVSPLTVISYLSRGDSPVLPVGGLPVGMSVDTADLGTNANDLLVRFYAPGNIGGIWGDSVSRGKVTGFPIRAMGVWSVTATGTATTIGEFGSYLGVGQSVGSVTSLAVAKLCTTQWTTALPLAAAS